jgi:hypothetical protein
VSFIVSNDYRLAEYHNHDFSEGRFERADFLGAIFTDCNFAAADFTRAYITGARFENCDFTFSKFDGTYMFSSQFKNCNFTCSEMTDVLLATVDFIDSPFTNVDWQGMAINSPPLLIQGIEYPITVLDNGYMQFGCKLDRIDWFCIADGKEMTALDGIASRRFWAKNRDWIIAMLVARGYYVHPKS